MDFRSLPKIELHCHLDASVRAETVAELAADGVVYGEVRFAPQLHMRRGLSLQQVLDAVYKGLSSRSGARTGLIVCCLRHDPPALSERIAQLAVDNPDKVCALD